MLRYALPLMLLALAVGCGGGAPNPPTYPAGPPSAGKNPPPREARAGRPAPPQSAEQKPASLEEQLDETMAELTKRLKLKPNQVAPVRKVLAEDQASKEDIRSAQASTTNVNTIIRLFEVQHKVEQETEAKLAKVLSKDQLEAYQEWLKEYRKRLGAMGVKPQRPRGKVPMGMGSGRPGGM